MKNEHKFTREYDVKCSITYTEETDYPTAKGISTQKIK